MSPARLGEEILKRPGDSEWFIAYPSIVLARNGGKLVGENRSCVRTRFLHWEIGRDSCGSWERVEDIMDFAEDTGIIGYLLNIFMEIWSCVVNLYIVYYKNIYSLLI